MDKPPQAQQLVDQAKAAYEKGGYPQAADLYLQASEAFLLQGDNLMAAEMANNRSVTLLMGGNAQGAYDACLGTDTIFANAGDKKRQAIALGNLASATQKMGKTKEALALFQQSSELLKECGEQDYRVYILKNISTLQFRLGQRLEAITSMRVALELEKNPSPRERVLKQLFGLVFH